MEPRSLVLALTLVLALVASRQVRPARLSRVRNEV